MESTGVYWKPVWNVLEGQLEVLLVNAQHIKGVPGRKPDQKDSEWIADLLQHGLLRGSFVPPREAREMRDLTRYRVSITGECNRIANRIQKVLEDANIKLASVATDPSGAVKRYEQCRAEHSLRQILRYREEGSARIRSINCRKNLLSIVRLPVESSEIDTYAQNSVGSISRVRGLRLPGTAEQQASAGEKDETSRDLRGEKDLALPLASPSRRKHALISVWTEPIAGQMPISTAVTTESASV